jgi:putative SOS response-associated peptidase YedK
VPKAAFLRRIHNRMPVIFDAMQAKHWWIRGSAPAMRILLRCCAVSL